MGALEGMEGGVGSAELSPMGLELEFWPADNSVADEPLRIPSGSTSRSPFGAGRVSVASESESSARACVGAWSSFFQKL